ncbi:MAG: hypothetical protein V7K48_14020 [Nostoc sp.]|uniref:hypothetical protein n=1 Tax=Nostoc sp. TaxID=1180 RepID=UPI002FFC8709
MPQSLFQKSLVSQYFSVKGERANGIAGKGKRKELNYLSLESWKEVTLDEEFHLISITATDDAGGLPLPTRANLPSR